MSERGASVLNSFDFAGIEELDPSLADGHRIIYEREVPFEMRLQESDAGPQDMGTLEAIRAKVLVLGDDDVPVNVRIELSSENDLFFHFTHEVDAEGFRAIQNEQKLMIDFHQYPAILARSFNNAINDAQR